MSDSEYWPRLCKDLRQALNLTQFQMADRLGVDQASYSRWERGITEPQYDMRRLIQGLAQGQGLATLDNIVTAVRLSPFPMILVDRGQRIIAASRSSGFMPAMTALEQTPFGEQSNLAEFDAALASSGFWEQQCPSMEYEAVIDGRKRLAAVVTAMVIRGEVYALVQRPGSLVVAGQAGMGGAAAGYPGLMAAC